MVYAYSWYLDIVCPDWEAFVEDDYKSVMPLTMRKKYNLHYTFCPPYTQQLGLFSTSKIKEKDVDLFLSKVPAKYKYIEMNLNEQNSFENDSFQIIPHVTYLVNLAHSYKDIFANYATQTKRNLKKAQAASLKIIKDIKPEKTIELFRANRGRQYSYKPAQYDTLNRLMLACINRGIGQSWGCYSKENEFCAGVFFLESNKRVIFLFSGANTKGYETHALTFLFNSYMEENAGRDVMFDFEGGTDPNLARFYKGFGSMQVNYLQIKKTLLPKPLKLIKELRDKIRASSGG